MSQIIGSDLKAKANDGTRPLVNPAIDSNIRHVSYDVSVGKIFIPDGGTNWKDTRLKEGYVKRAVLDPQGLAVLESLEELDVPKNMFAIAHPKSSLCESGILILNTGIIDPGFKGHLKGTAINFSKKPVDLLPKTAFLRITFHPIEEDGDDAPRRGWSAADLAYNYPHEFMNVTELARKVVRDSILLYGGIFLTITFLLLGFLPYVLERSWPFGGPKSAVYELESRIDRLEKSVEPAPERTREDASEGGSRGVDVP